MEKTIKANTKEKKENKYWYSQIYREIRCQVRKGDGKKICKICFLVFERRTRKTKKKKEVCIKNKTKYNLPDILDKLLPKFLQPQCPCKGLHW